MGRTLQFKRPTDRQTDDQGNRIDPNQMAAVELYQTGHAPKPMVITRYPFSPDVLNDLFEGRLGLTKNMEAVKDASAVNILQESLLFDFGHNRHVIVRVDYDLGDIIIDPQRAGGLKEETIQFGIVYCHKYDCVVSSMTVDLDLPNVHRGEAFHLSVKDTHSVSASAGTLFSSQVDEQEETDLIKKQTERRRAFQAVKQEQSRITSGETDHESKSTSSEL